MERVRDREEKGGRNERKREREWYRWTVRNKINY